MADLPQYDSPTLRKHKQQRFWQILVPILLVIVLSLVAGSLVFGAETNQTRLWADVATIWLIAPLMLIALLCMVVLGGMIYAIARLTRIVPRYTLQAQNIVLRLTIGVKRGADVAVKPVLWTRQVRAVIEYLFKHT